MATKLAKRMLIAPALLVAAAGMAAAAPAGWADVSNAASCRLTAHLYLRAGSYESDRGSVDCAGTLDGLPVGSGGTIEMWGAYTEAWSSGACKLMWHDGLFDARIEEAVSFIDESYVYAQGGFNMASDPSMQVSGDGEANQQPFLEQGTAMFTPDAAQSCGSLRSGTLTQRVTLIDGGTGNPAAQAAVSQREAEPAVPAPASGRPGAAGKSPHRRCRHHKHRSGKHHRRCRR